MSDSESSESDDKSSKEEYRGHREDAWRHVDRGIWARKTESRGFRRAVSGSMADFASLLSSTPFLLFVATPAGGLGAYLSFLFAYDLGGGRFFGVYLIGIWLAAIIGFVALIEKTGYSRNFRGWDFPLRRLVVLPVAFLIPVGLFLLLFFLAGAFR